MLAPDVRTGEQALRACGEARAQLERLLAAPAPAGVVVVGDSMRGAVATQRSDERWSFAIAPGEASTERELGDGRHLSAAAYLTHEIAHRVATAMLFPGDTAFGPEVGYGSPLPDWLDEALALLTEPPADQKARLDLLFAGEMIYALPLRRFLYMAHPALSQAPPGSPVRRVFYGQSLGFALFLRERAGNAGMRTLVAALGAGQKQGAALTSLPGVPPDGGALEQAWLAWLRTRRAGGQAAGGAARPPSPASPAAPAHDPSAALAPGGGAHPAHP